jgi:uncharacterized protein
MRVTMDKRLKQRLRILVTVVAGLLLANALVHLLTESWWFDAVGFAEVFWTRLTWQVVLGLLTAGIYFGWLWGNYRIALHFTRHRTFNMFEASELEEYTDAIIHALALLGSGVIAVLAGSFAVSEWTTVLKYLHRTAFGEVDPIFKADIGFWIFQLPLVEGVRVWLLILLLLGLILSGTIYSLKGIFNPDSHRVMGDGAIKMHLSVQSSGVILLWGWGFWLDRYHLLYGSGGVVFGAGYTDVHGRLFALTVLSILAIGFAISLLLSAQRQGWRIPLQLAGVFVVTFLLLNGLYPWAVQQFVVSPNELEKEKPYLTHNIRFTQTAYHLNDVQRQPYSAETNLNPTVLQANQPTIRNIRLWDYRPLLSTYRQLQEIRLYYRFSHIDVDRYRLKDTYQQVMLSAREFIFSQVPQTAQTWVNQRLKYTHGYGLVMSPVNRITSDGLPELYIKDLPPRSLEGLNIQQPAIYYGEETNHYIFTGATTDEFDYSRGNNNAMTRYTGQGGVPLSSFGRKLAYAYNLGSLQLLISDYLTPQSRVHYHRQIQQRVKHIVPFLRFDSDPYLTIVNGRLQWIVDAYTTSDRYPFSEPVVESPEATPLLQERSISTLVGDRLNYIRNSVKVVVDAYDGTVHFFAVDETDPILKTYRKIFPHLFLPKASIPPDVKAHFRYPQDLFKIQAQMYLAYHMNNPEEFYNREDLWHFPIQTYEGTEVTMQPYYTIMRLPNTEEAEFVLILPFTPTNKDNMIAWAAARSNGKEYGKLLLYEFPKQKLIYGPRQIEARIDQEPQISQQFTLWNQSGSKVIRGDLLVIPIEQSLLYVEPVYLRAEQGALPELKRVIVAYDKDVVMAETLDAALNEIFGQSQPEKETPIAPVAKFSALVSKALAAQQKAEAAARQGNWADYGRYQQELAETLRSLNQKN